MVQNQNDYLYNFEHANKKIKQKLTINISFFIFLMQNYIDLEKVFGSIHKYGKN